MRPMNVRWIGVVLACALGLTSSAWADYFEVRRSANLYQDADRTSPTVQHVEPASSGAPLQLAVVPGPLLNGYVHVALSSGSSGWIYKSRGRLFAGNPPGGGVVTTGEGEETTPDISGPVPASGADASLPPISDPGLQVYMFSIGQADSLLVVGPPPARKTLLVDLGEPIRGGTDEDFKEVRDRVKQITNHDSVNYFVLTHFHGDHAGHPPRGPCTSPTAKMAASGIFALLDDTQRPFHIDTWIDRGDDGTEYTPKPSQSHCGVISSMGRWVADGRVGQRETAQIGPQQIDLGPGVKVEIVAEDGKVFAGDAGAMAYAVQQHGNVYSASQPASENDYSVAMEISLGDFEMFLGGDLTGSDAQHTNDTHSIERFGSNATVYTNVESYMVRHWRQIGRESAVEVYRANHHGSEHSSNPDLASALKPLVVLYSTGGDYGHPMPATVQRFSGKDQFVTTAVSTASWPQGFPPSLGSVVGEIHIGVATDGSRFQVNEAVYRSRTDAQESGQ